MGPVRLREGKTTITVESRCQSGRGSVFYNPRMEITRDATVLLVSHIRPVDYLDAMGASGIRGIRIARECGIPVTVNDRSRIAAELIRRNAAEAGVNIEVTAMDANVLASSRKFDAVDLDPFGSPAPFIDSGIRSARRYLFVTATDTAPLCGAHLQAGRRRYFANPRNCEYHREVGLRILLGFIARETIKYDRGMEPLFCFTREHFVRVHLHLLRGASAADRTLGQIGYIHQCPECIYRSEETGIIPGRRCCPSCSATLIPVGPLWLGPVNDRSLLESLSDRVPRMDLGTERDLARLLQILSEELPTASHYDHHRIARRLSVSPGKIDDLIAALRDEGYSAGRVHYSGTGFKTDAPPETIYEVVSRGSRP
ncbi:MAG: tRNA (guanine(10)-N(2))-dimethyltransferase [Methanoculleaceae archaeon]